MKIQRSGYTETDLIFCNFLKNQLNIKDSLLDTIEKNFINWLYTTSGWYDKNINGSYFDIDYISVLNSYVYKEWIHQYSMALKNSDHVTLLFHRDQFKDYTDKYLSVFINSFQINHDPKLDGYWTHANTIHHLLKNKKVLVISSFGKLIYNQYISNNIFYINHNFPIFASLEYIDFPYCFFNSGPHQNGLETLDNITNEIQKIDFDIALVGAGSYAAILTDRIHSTLNKSSITMCSGIARMFGIDPGSDEKPYWVTKIPEEYIPKDYIKIESGRYWIGKSKSEIHKKNQ
jgi:hypothetical protein